MLEVCILIAFGALLVLSLTLGLPLSFALLSGMALFIVYGFIRGFNSREIITMAFEERHGTAQLMVVFSLIGMLGASWRAAGTIPSIALLSSSIPSEAIVPASFLLCSLVSVLCGSSFAAAAIIGTICMSSGTALGACPALLGGAILSGCFVGDRCSPLSSSALLVSRVTQTDFSDNLRRMLLSSLIPIVLSILFFCVFSAQMQATPGALEQSVHLTRAITSQFRLNVLCYLPALLIGICTLLRFSIVRTMLVSLMAASGLAIFMQHMNPLQLLSALVLGYASPSSEMAAFIDGGGIFSMAELMLISAIIDIYSGLMKGTGLLDGLGQLVEKLAHKTTPFAGVLLTSIGVSLIACDQFLVISLTQQLCEQVERDSSALALDLANSAIVLPALTPWSTSCIGILAIVGAPFSSVLFAAFAWLLPLTTLVVSLLQKLHPHFVYGTFARTMGYDARDDAYALISATESSR